VRASDLLPCRLFNGQCLSSHGISQARRVASSSKEVSTAAEVRFENRDLLGRLGGAHPLPGRQLRLPLGQLASGDGRMSASSRSSQARSRARDHA
jgi:hypothetical protein